MGWIWDKVGKRRSLRDGEARQERFIWPDGQLRAAVRRARAADRGGRRPGADRPPGRAAGSRRTAPSRSSPGAPSSFRRGLDPRAFERRRRRRSPTTRSSAASPTTSSPSCSTPGSPREVGDEYLGAARRDRVLHRAQPRARARAAADRALLGQHRRPPLSVRRPDRAFELRRAPRTPAGACFSHVTNYLPADHELLGLDAERAARPLRSTGCGMLNPSFERSWVRGSWLFREPAGAADRRASATAS